jgi:hypothetical protein
LKEGFEALDAAWAKWQIHPEPDFDDCSDPETEDSDDRDDRWRRQRSDQARREAQCVDTDTDTEPQTVPHDWKEGVKAKEEVQTTLNLFVILSLMCLSSFLFISRFNLFSLITTHTNNTAL